MSPSFSDSSTVDNPIGYLRHYGSDNGAKILIESSEFEYSRFCKGLLVYREGVDYQAINSGVLGYQKEATSTPDTLGTFVDDVCDDCYIIMQDSTFTHLNHGTSLRTLRPLLDYMPTVRNSTKLDSSSLGAGAITAPMF